MIRKGKNEWDRIAHLPLINSDNDQSIRLYKYFKEWGFNGFYVHRKDDHIIDLIVDTIMDFNPRILKLHNTKFYYFEDNSKFIIDEYENLHLVMAWHREAM